MRRPFVLFVMLFVCVAAVTVPGLASAGQDLTAVQRAFINKKPLSLIDATPDSAPLIFGLRQGTPGQGAVPSPQSAPAKAPSPGFKRASFAKVFVYSLQLSFYEHVMRVVAQDFTREELKGPFFQDWFDSVHFPHKWGDLDSWEVNYLGHAMHGAAATRIWMQQREPKATTRKEWAKSMGRAFLFSVLFSEMYEIGPMSEASIGNVGLRSGRTGWVDHIWTPTGAVLWYMAENAIDKYFLSWVDTHVPFVMARAAARMILNPGWMLANIGQNRTPWARPDRALTGGIR